MRFRGIGLCFISVLAEQPPGGMYVALNLYALASPVITHLLKNLECLFLNLKETEDKFYIHMVLH
jgi:hypothetical protein